MKERLLLLILLFAVILAGIWRIQHNYQKEVLPDAPVAHSSVELSNTQRAVAASPTVDSTQLTLTIPFVLEAPDGNWTGPWKDACEEATMTMIDAFYKGVSTVSIADAKSYMQMLFDVQNKLYNSNMNSSSSHLTTLIDEHSSFSSTVVTNPTLDAIKNELRNGHPVISLHRGSELQNPNIHFLSSGSSYHVLVIKGFDDAAGEFIVNDPGDATAGESHRYGYTLLMNSLHDYNYANYKADGPARVLFTFAKKGVK